MELCGIVIYTMLIGLVTKIIYDWIQVMAWRSKYNIKGPVPLPIVGSLLMLFQRTEEVNDELCYKKYGPIYGLVSQDTTGSIKNIHVADLNVLKKLMIKDHLKFQNRYYWTNDPSNKFSGDLLLSINILLVSNLGLLTSLPSTTSRQQVENLFVKTMEGLVPKPLDMGLLSLQDAHWKRVRSIVTPSYSPGKIKKMTSEVNYAAGLLVAGLEEKAKSGESVDSKFHFGCFTMDVIAGTGFGIRTDAYKNPDQPFITLAKKVFGQDAMKNPMVILALLFPKLGVFLSEVLKVSIFYPLDSLGFFIKLIKEIIADRESKQDTSRSDFLQLMMNAEEESKDTTSTTSKKLTTDEMLAQGFMVFIAGYETTASLLTYVSYVLATHPDIQDKLTEEIDSWIKTDVDVSYDKLMEMPYLEQVICETLRMYPPITRMNRTTSEHQDVEIDGYWFPKDTMITYSIWQIHHQLGLYPEPDKFKPERFSQEEKQKRDQFSFIPFGQGPRNCIGMRLALLESKAAVVHILRKLKFVKVAETEEPLQLAVHTFLTTKKPVKVGVMLR